MRNNSADYWNNTPLHELSREQWGNAVRWLWEMLFTQTARRRHQRRFLHAGRLQTTRHQVGWVSGL